MKQKAFSIGTLVTILVIAFLYLPIIMVVANAFNADQTLIQWGGFTLEWIADAFANTRVRDAAITSIVIGILSTVCAVTLSLTAVLAVSKLPKAASNALQTLTYARLVVPEVVVAAGILIVIRELGLNTGMWATVAGHIIFCSAYATLVLQSRYATLSGTFDEAAADLGASPFRIFLRVILPLMLPAVLISSILSFTFSFDDVVSTVFLAGAELETLPVLILGLTRHGSSAEVNAIAVIVMFVSILLMLLMALASFAPKKKTVSKDEQEVA